MSFRITLSYRIFISCFTIISMFLIGLSSGVQAKSITKSKKYAAIVYDINSNRIIYGRNMDRHRYPASLTKIMTLYMLFEALDKNRISLKTKMKISKKAAKQPPSNLGLKAGRYISVKQAIHALIVRSANDVAVVVGEFLGGSEKKFAHMLTAKARKIGMRNTIFKNASGLPNKKQYTTARDMIIMSKRIMHDFRQYYHYFKLTKFRYGNKTFYTHNKLVVKVEGIEGMKTGYIRASGYNVINSYRKNGYHLLAVVMGGNNSKQRDNHMKKLITTSVRKAKKAGGKALFTTELPKLPPKKPSSYKSLIFTKLDIPSKPKSEIDTHSTELTLVQLLESYLKNGYKNNIREAKNTSQIIVKEERKVNITTNSPTISFTKNNVYKKGLIVTKDEYIENKSIKNNKKIPSENEWHIQIGAYYSSKLAKNRTQIALAKYPTLFEGHTPYVMKSGKRIYRSRFKGYSKNDARQACITLRNEGIDCIKLRQS